MRENTDATVDIFVNRSLDANFYSSISEYIFVFMNFGNPVVMRSFGKSSIGMEMIFTENYFQEIFVFLFFFRKE